VPGRNPRHPTRSKIFRENKGEAGAPDRTQLAAAQGEDVGAVREPPVATKSK